MTRSARVCVVRQYYYPLDIRVRREVEALLQVGYEVDVVCLRAPGELARERRGNLTVHRLPLAHDRGGAIGYVGRYGLFLALASLVVAGLHLRRRYAMVQVHSLPDVLVLAGLFPRLTGARLLLDLHEVMPEFFATKFGKPLRHPLVRLVARAEQMSIRMADRAMTCTDQMREVFVLRGADPDKVSVLLNAADEAVFDADRYPHQPDPAYFTLVCHGSVEERYGLDLVVQAVHRLRDELPALRFHVYGDGACRQQLRALVTELDLEDRVWFSNGFVSMEELLQGLACADAGIVAMRRDAFRDLTQCNKMYEYLVLHLPVISSRTRSVEASFGDEAVAYFEPGDVDDLVRVVRQLHDDPGLRRRLVTGGTHALQPYRWAEQRRRYQRLVEELLADVS